VSQILLPLLRLEPAVSREPLLTRRASDRSDADRSDAPRPAGPTRTLDLEPHPALLPWTASVRASADPCMVLDAEGRVAAVSAAAAELLGLEGDPVADLVGTELDRLVSALDFSALAGPAPEHQATLPPLVSLRRGVVTRGLVRLRRADGSLSTLDVVGLPLAEGAGCLAFFQPV
jgi:PAS domain-containing protein